MGAKRPCKVLGPFDRLLCLQKTHMKKPTLTSESLPAIVLARGPMISSQSFRKDRNSQQTTDAYWGWLGPDPMPPSPNDGECPPVTSVGNITEEDTTSLLVVILLVVLAVLIVLLPLLLLLWLWWQRQRSLNRFPYPPCSSSTFLLPKKNPLNKDQVPQDQSASFVHKSHLYFFKKTKS